MKAVILRQIRANYHKVIQSIPEIPTIIKKTQNTAPSAIRTMKIAQIIVTKFLT